MTERVNPSQGATVTANQLAQTIYQHGSTGDWIVPAGDTVAADLPGADGIDHTAAAFNAFDHASSSGLDVTIDGGEAFVGGAWLATDAQHTVTLPDDTIGQDVVLAWAPSAPNGVFVGRAGFEPSGATTITLWTFDTASGSVSDVTDQRQLGKPAAGGYTDEDAQDAVGSNVGDGLSYDDPSGSVAMDVVTTGSATLSSGAATVDTGVSSDTTATFQVALGPATDDAEISASIVAVSGGNYTVHLDEVNTSVGNPSVEYDVIRVR